MGLSRAKFRLHEISKFHKLSQGNVQNFPFSALYRKKIADKNVTSHQVFLERYFLSDTRRNIN